MVARTTISPAWVDRQLAQMVAGQRMAGEEPTPEAIEAARKVLLGQATADEAIRDALAELEHRHGFSR